MTDHRVQITGPDHQADGPVWVARCSCTWWACAGLRDIVEAVAEHQDNPDAKEAPGGGTRGLL